MSTTTCDVCKEVATHEFQLHLHTAEMILFSRLCVRHSAQFLVRRHDVPADVVKMPLIRS